MKCELLLMIGVRLLEVVQPHRAWLTPGEERWTPGEAGQTDKEEG